MAYVQFVTVVDYGYFYIANFPISLYLISLFLYIEISFSRFYRTIFNGGFPTKRVDEPQHPLSRVIAEGVLCKKYLGL